MKFFSSLLPSQIRSPLYFFDSLCSKNKNRKKGKRKKCCCGKRQKIFQEQWKEFSFVIFCCVLLFNWNESFHWNALVSIAPHQATNAHCSAYVRARFVYAILVHFFSFGANVRTSLPIIDIGKVLFALVSINVWRWSFICSNGMAHCSFVRFFFLLLFLLRLHWFSCNGIVFGMSQYACLRFPF